MIIIFNYHQTVIDSSKACLQRKKIIDNQGQIKELIKTNDKCVNNKMNKWFIKQKAD